MKLVVGTQIILYKSPNPPKKRRLSFSLDSPPSLDNISNKWIPEIKNYCPKTPVLLVGTKKEFRECEWTKKRLSSVNQEPVTPETGRQLVDLAKLNGYFECSSKEKCGVKEIFDEAARLAVTHKKSKKNKCKLQ